VVTPFSANRKIQRSRSAEHILDENEYTYVVPHEYASQTLNRRPSRGQPPGRPPPPDPAKLVPKTPPAVHQKPVAPVRGKTKPISPDERPNSPKLNGTPKVVEKPVSPTSPKRLPKPPEFPPPPLKTSLAKNVSLPADPPIRRAKPRPKPRS